MKSIRGRLLSWFLLSLALVWLIAGGGSLYSYRAGLMAGVESELQSLLRQVRVSQPAGPGGTGRGGPRYGRNSAVRTDFGPDIFWQIWPLPDEANSTRSANLAMDLPRLSPSHGKNTIRKLTLQNRVRVMAAGARFGMGSEYPSDGRAGRGRRGPVEITVAKDLTAIRTAITRASIAIILAGIAAAGLAVAWVFFVVRDGLAPLRSVAEEVATINTTSLDERFDVEGLPRELQPIATRLNQLMTRLETSFARERQFSSDLAHEMRTPIAELRLLAESAAKWPNEEGGPDAWRTVGESVDQMERTVQAMLQLAHFEQASSERPRERVPLRALAEECWTPHAPRAATRNISLRLNLQPDTTVPGDSILWRHLLGNLIENAVNYADEKTELAISEEETATGKVVSVSNTASNLKLEDVDHLFDRFWRGDQARGTGSHCGLGLPLARACGTAMGLQVHARLLNNNHRLEIRIEPDPGDHESTPS